MTMTWLSILPPLVAVAIAIWSKRIIPSLFIGLLLGGYLLAPTIIGGFETAVDQIVSTLTDADSLQVLLFLYLFSGLIGIIKKSGGIQAFSALAGRRVSSKRGVFYVLWALVPVTFIDCGFRIVGAGSITRTLAEKNGIASERLAFMLNNTASPVIELIPIATTYVGFNVAIVALGLANAGLSEQVSAYSVWISAIPLEFFSLIVIAITFLSIFYNPRRRDPQREQDTDPPAKIHKTQPVAPVIEPRIANIAVPMLTVITLSIVLFWLVGHERTSESSWIAAIMSTEPNKAMLVALVVSVFLTATFYAFQRYKVKELTADIIAGGNEIVPTLIILTLAWPLAAVSQALGLSAFIQQYIGGSLPAWGLGATLFIVSAAVTYFIGSGWGSASLIMPFAIPLAASLGANMPLCVAAVITGGTFGDVTSPVAGMTNMASRIAHADHTSYLRYAAPYNFTSAALAAVLYLVVGLVM